MDPKEPGAVGRKAEEGNSNLKVAGIDLQMVGGYLWTEAQDLE
jgi:hypothetical protein